MKMTKVFNLTDVSTPELVQRKLVGHTFAFGREMLSPGAFAEVSEDQVHAMSGIQELVRIGVAAVGGPPPAYLVAKAQQPKAPASIVQPPQPAPRAASRAKEVVAPAGVGPVPAALLTPPEKGK